jgi:uncharacterized membrane protein YdbT with pleckstrin-like domain
MREQLKQWVLEILRVPSRPSLPRGAENVRVFRAAPAFYRYRLALWVLAQAGALLGLTFGLAAGTASVGEFDSSLLNRLLIAAEAFAWGGFLLQLPLSLMAVRLDFELRWYIVSDRSLRIREGVWHVQEKTMTFANIQQISIRQNPLQRLLRIADVEVRTAGGGEGKGKEGSSGGDLHEAYFRGVDNAEEIRTAIQERVRRHRDSGLGDLDDSAPADAVATVSALAPAADDEVLVAARALHREVRALRGRALSRR